MRRHIFPAGLLMREPFPTGPMDAILLQGPSHVCPSLRFLSLQFLPPLLSQPNSLIFLPCARSHGHAGVLHSVSSLALKVLLRRLWVLLVFFFRLAGAHLGLAPIKCWFSRQVGPSHGRVVGFPRFFFLLFDYDQILSRAMRRFSSFLWWGISTPFLPGRL